MPEEDATGACAEVRRPANRERLDVQRGFLEPRRVVSDENERAETDLAALNHLAAGNHDDDRKTNFQLHQQVAKTPAPWWAPTIVVLSLTVERGGRYGEARS